MGGITLRKKRPIKQTRHDESVTVSEASEVGQYDGDLNAALDYLERSIASVSDDYVARRIRVGHYPAACVFLAGICDDTVIARTLREIHSNNFDEVPSEELCSYLAERVLSASQIEFSSSMAQLKTDIVSGQILLILHDVVPALIVRARKVEHRALQAPLVESTVRGAQIGFVEDVSTNITVLRAGLNSEALSVKFAQVGTVSRKEVAVIYLNGTASEQVVTTVMGRLQSLAIDAVVQGADVEQQIVDKCWVPVPLTRATQRVDNTIKELVKGKVAVMVDGDPMVLLLPATIQDFFQIEEDYGRSTVVALFVRLIRVVACVVALYLPSLYIAFVDFNPELLPKVLGTQIAQSREHVPFPAIMEVLMMQTVVEILREATLRLPKQMGQTIGIVGGLVVGEATVQAGLVSNILIVVIALTAISVFVCPSYEFGVALRLGSFVMFTASAVMGLYAIVIASIVILYELSAVKSFGVSYLEPFAGRHWRDALLDGILRLPMTLIRQFPAKHNQPEMAMQSSQQDRGPRWIPNGNTPGVIPDGRHKAGQTRSSRHRGKPTS